MQCSQCKTKMEKGFIDRGVWVKGYLRYPLGKDISWWPRKTEYITAWLCRECGKIELKLENAPEKKNS